MQRRQEVGEWGQQTRRSFGKTSEEGVKPARGDNRISVVLPKQGVPPKMRRTDPTPRPGHRVYARSALAIAAEGFKNGDVVIKAYGSDDEPRTTTISQHT